MSQAMYSFSMNYDTNTDACTDCDINQRIFYIMISQLKLGKCTRIHVSIDFNFFGVKSALKNVQKFNVLP